MSPAPPRTLSAAQALAELRQGNDRFCKNVRSLHAMASQVLREVNAEKQAPKAIILSCSDSRVPSEMVFDCGVGDLFVVRVAGNVCAPSLVGSVEFAAATFGTELVVVMGHTGCGAVEATVRALLEKSGSLSSNIRDIVERISPAVRPLLQQNFSPADLLREATRANVLHTVDHLRHGSRVLEERISEGRLAVVGAEYALETGFVEFFELPFELRNEQLTPIPSRRFAME